MLINLPNFVAKTPTLDSHRLGGCFMSLCFLNAFSSLPFSALVLHFSSASLRLKAYIGPTR